VKCVQLKLGTLQRKHFCLPSAEWKVWACDQWAAVCETKL